MRQDAATLTTDAPPCLLNTHLAALAETPIAAISLVATDGCVALVGRDDDPLCMFGLVQATDPDMSVEQLLSTYQGRAGRCAPQLEFQQGDTVRITLTNVGVTHPPRVGDFLAIHWQGFESHSSLGDDPGELSVAVPAGTQLTFFHRSRHPGTYLYHCDIEDGARVHTGSTGIAVVRPAQDGCSIGGFTKFAYQDGDGTTGYDRHFVLVLDEVWASSSLIQLNEGERVLLRMANPGCRDQAMQLPGITMTVVGEGGSLLRDGTTDLFYDTDMVRLGPGETRDVVFTAPAFDEGLPVLHDTVGDYNVHLGGGMAEVRVYPVAHAVATLPAQTAVGQTYC